MSQVDSSTSKATNSFTRVDAAHVKADAQDEAIDELLSEAGDGPVAEQVLAHAGQLATHLRTRQRDLDRRESQLNARAAELENDLRASRMWFHEREQESAQRELELQQHVNELEERATAIAATEVSADLDSESLQRDQVRANALDKAEEQLNKQFAKLKLQSDLIAAEREELRAQKREHECEVVQRDKNHKAAFAKKKRQLDQREKFLDQREATLDGLQSDVGRLHRDSLEMRLIAEQLWSQLAGKLTPAELTKSISDSRSKLAEHFQVEQDRVAQQRQELTDLAVKLENRQLQLTRQRRELEEWAQRRDQEIEEQAARLVAREQELDRQEQNHLETESKWDDERRRYERQIRDLSKLVSRPQRIFAR